MFDLSKLREQLPGRELYWHPTIDSTMYEAHRLASLGCPSGTVVGADEQLAGIGRHGHSWHSEAGQGLYFTIVLRMLSTTPIVTLMLGVAVQDAIATACGVRCDLRWPNDLLVESKKVCGILTQVHEGAILAGVGINANQKRFPEDIEGIATSLCVAAKKPVDREDLLGHVLESVDRHAVLSKDDILRLFTQGSSYVQGRRVVVDNMHGTTAGLDANGFLILERPDHGRTLILAGGVRPDPAVA